MERVNELARANGIRRHEVRGLLDTLSSQGLIDVSASGIAVLGVSQSRLLEHAAEVFEAQGPEDAERAVIDLAEMASQKPVSKADCSEELSDTHKLSKIEID